MALGETKTVRIKSAVKDTTTKTIGISAIVYTPETYWFYSETIDTVTPVQSIKLQTQQYVPHGNWVRWYATNNYGEIATVPVTHDVTVWEEITDIVNDDNHWFALCLLNEDLDSKTFKDKLKLKAELYVGGQQTKIYKYLMDIDYFRDFNQANPPNRIMYWFSSLANIT